MTLAIPDFAQASVLVAGDIMLDRYWSGPTGRISPEAPVPVVHIAGVEERPGGAGNVAMNLASLGVATDLVAVTGADEAGETLERLLTERGVRSSFVTTADLPTTTKLRVLSRNQQLIRLDFEKPMNTAGVAPGLRDAMERYLDTAGALILSDYGKGALDEVDTLITAARRAGVPVLVDPKGSDFSRYRGATVVTPNLAEFEAVVGPCPNDQVLVERARRLCAELELENLLITRSEKGMTLVSADEPVVNLPAEAREVFDVTGAGDTVIAVTGAGLALGLPVAEASALANLAAGLVVGRLGVASVTPGELRHALHKSGKGGRSVVDEDELLALVAESRLRGERVVMTNGCFDILHAGHVTYLEEAKSLGDRLVVAVNDDASTRRLKGPQRPVNPLADRMLVLAGMASVDWVVPFFDDTPEGLICRVLPDILVKGADYHPDQIAGGQCVRDHGGEVRVLSFREGRSTSAIIDRLRG
jgi:D-beta-D-heptose 7-phosphate kinase/D-beta-D-heptose 1-phosphate adenosyltransferase